jgi:anti-sigma-K factor RskA
MTDQPRQPHEEWEELAAAHALDALDPQDEQRLSAHMASCDICQHNVDDYKLVAAQLGSLADDEEPAPSWQRIRSSVVTEGSARVETPHPSEQQDERALAPVASLPEQAPSRPPWRRPWVIAAAAAVVLLIAGGLAGWGLSSRSTQPSASAALRACEQQSGCRTVRLHSGAARDRAAVIVDSGHASVVPLALPAAPGGRMYVLWQLPRDGSPIALASFRQTKHETRDQELARPYADTAAFALSVEPAGSLPAQPSQILALGATT